MALSLGLRFHLWGREDTADKGFVDQPSFRENGKEQLKEMIRQHYNILVSVFGDCSMN